MSDVAKVLNLQAHNPINRVPMQALDVCFSIHKALRKVLFVENPDQRSHKGHIS